MSVNLPLTGSGDATATAATDDIAGVAHPYAKLEDGTVGSTTPIKAGEGAATNGMRVAIATDSTVIGAVTETAPATDTASSGINGRLQRIAQRLTALIALLPASIGQKAKAASFAVTIASDQDALPVSDGGGSLTVDGTVAVSGTVTVDTELATADLDTGAGSDNRVAVGMVLAESGGGLLVGSAHPMPISGTVSVSGAVDTELTTADLDTGAGTDTRAVVGLAIAESGGAQLVGSAHPLPISGTVTANAGTGTRTITGDVAHDAVDSGSPVKVGGKARQTNPTAVADGDRVDASFDDVGRQIIQPIQARDLISHQHTQIASSSSETTVVTAGGSGVFNDIVSIMITNQTATAVNATLKDSTGGTTRAIIAIPASGGAIFQPATIFPQLAAANNNWTITLSSASVTVNITALFAKNV